MKYKIIQLRHSELDSESHKNSKVILKPKEILNQVQDDVVSKIII